MTHTPNPSSDASANPSREQLDLFISRMESSALLGFLRSHAKHEQLMGVMTLCAGLMLAMFASVIYHSGVPDDFGVTVVFVFVMLTAVGVSMIHRARESRLRLIHTLANKGHWAELAALGALARPDVLLICPGVALPVAMPFGRG